MRPHDRSRMDETDPVGGAEIFQVRRQQLAGHWAWIAPWVGPGWISRHGLHISEGAAGVLR